MLSIFLLSPVAMERTVIRRATVAKPGRSRWTLVPCTFYLRTSSAVSPAIIRETLRKNTASSSWSCGSILRCSVYGHTWSSSIDDLPDPQPKGRQEDPSDYSPPNQLLPWPGQLSSEHLFPLNGNSHLYSYPMDAFYGLHERYFGRRITSYHDS